MSMNTPMKVQLKVADLEAYLRTMVACSMFTPDIADVARGLHATDNIRRFKYVCAKNARKIGTLYEKHHRAYMKAIEPIPALWPFLEARCEAAIPFCVLDEHGSPEIDDEKRYRIREDADVEAWLAIDSKLECEHKDAIAEQAIVQDKANMMLREVIEIELHGVQYQDLPITMGGVYYTAAPKGLGGMIIGHPDPDSIPEQEGENIADCDEEPELDQHPV